MQALLWTRFAPSGTDLGDGASRSFPQSHPALSLRQPTRVSALGLNCHVATYPNPHVGPEAVSDSLPGMLFAAFGSVRCVGTPPGASCREPNRACGVLLCRETNQGCAGVCRREEVLTQLKWVVEELPMACAMVSDPIDGTPIFQLSPTFDLQAARSAVAARLG